MAMAALRPPRVAEFVVHALGNEDSVRNAEVHRNGDDHWDQVRPESSDQVGDVSNEPDTEEGH